MDCLALTGFDAPVGLIAAGAAAAVAVGVLLLVPRRRRVVAAVSTAVGGLLLASMLTGAATVPAATSCDASVQTAPADPAPPSVPLVTAPESTPESQPAPSPEPTPAPTPDPETEAPVVPAPVVSVAIDGRSRTTTYLPTATVTLTPVTLTNTSTVDEPGPVRMRVASLSELSIVTGFFAAPGAPVADVVIVDDSDPQSVLIELHRPIPAGEPVSFRVEISQIVFYSPGCSGGLGLTSDSRPFAVDVLDSEGTTTSSARLNPPGTCEI